MANTLFIIADDVFKALPSSVSTAAVNEVKRLFKFMSSLSIDAREPGRFPARIDFTDAVVRIVMTDDDVGAYQQPAVRQQKKNIAKSLAANGINVAKDKDEHQAATPERGGVGFQAKAVVAAGSQKIAMTITGGVASAQSAEQAVVEGFAGGRTVEEIRKHRNDHVNGTANRKPMGKAYDGTPDGQKDAADLALYDLLKKGMKDWPGKMQDAAGVALGRIIAHEARHQFVLEHFRGGGLGASEPSIWGDKNFELFDSDDQKEMASAIATFNADQRKANIVAETNLRGEPFPF